MLRIYVNALLKGNPFAIAVTLVGMVLLSVGPFYEGLSKRGVKLDEVIV